METSHARSADFARQVSKLLPRGQKILGVKVRFEETTIKGALKIRSPDLGKTFLSDFEARVGPRGQIIDFVLEGKALLPAERGV